MGKRRERSEKRKRKQIVYGILIGLLVVLLAAGAYFLSIFGSIQRTSISDKDEELGINTSSGDVYDEDIEGYILKRKSENYKKPLPINIKRSDEVVNIALFGLDSRKPGYWSRSDSIMVVSIDKTYRKIKVTSFMRDIYIPIPGRNSDKINAAYAYGGPELAIKTLNTNFGLNIRDYVTVNFFGLEKLINKVGGLDINVKSYEIDNINKYIDEVNGLSGSPLGTYHIKKAGLQRLNGRQAVSYGRIRDVGNGDYERTERQRRVINLLFQKIKSNGVIKLPGTVKTLLPFVQTSLSNTEIIDLASFALDFDVKNLEEFRVPIEGEFKTGRVEGSYVIELDMDKTLEKLHKFIFEVEEKN